MKLLGDTIFDNSLVVTMVWSGRFEKGLGVNKGVSIINMLYVSHCRQLYVEERGMPIIVIGSYSGKLYDIDIKIQVS